MTFFFHQVRFCSSTIFLNALASGFGVYVIHLPQAFNKCSFELNFFFFSLYSAQIFQSQSPSRPQHLPLRTLVTGERQLLATPQALTAIPQANSRTKVL